MLVRLSTKGQLIIPGEIRKALGLEAGTYFDVRLENDEIILAPVAHISPLDRLYGKYPQADLLSELETDHREELEHGR
jgi:AbrB family looped-hinge helix DNA binding protein